MDAISHTWLSCVSQCRARLVSRESPQALRRTSSCLLRIVLRPLDRPLSPEAQRSRTPGFPDPLFQLFHTPLNLFRTGSTEAALPDCSNGPAPVGKRYADPPVPEPVSRNLLQPEFGPRLWPLEQVTIVSVPETAMDEDCDPSRGQHQIGPRPFDALVQPVSDSAGMKR